MIKKVICGLFTAKTLESAKSDQSPCKTLNERQKILANIIWLKL